MNERDQHLRPVHPRRPPAHRSVSLLHSPRSTGKRSPDSHSASDSSPSSLQPLVGKGSSGESSNADRWFDKSNNEVTARANNDPPFFFQQSSSEDKTPPQDQRRVSGLPDYNHSLPRRDGLVRMDTEGSGSEDFRGVIDDLTIQNKKLKRRLKRYEKLHDAHLKDEKLFEVRVHGLPATKKKELEHMLRSFALGLSEQPAQTPSSLSNLYERVVPGLVAQKTNSTTVTDSAYASASASGQGSSAPSGASAINPRKRPYNPSAKSRQQNIQTYLHEIPQGLLPQQPAAMSEKNKKRLVVRRLEQIFSGKGAVQGDHHHQLQQQEVSQSAAKAERSASEALGKRTAVEGSREARIMKNDSEALDEADAGSPRPAAPEATLHIDPAQGTVEHDFAEGSSSTSPHDQRPTRPLDLDPQRAQVPAENLLYIRHLGFSPPDVENSPEDGHGWIYLNLLINMAQLHTINVTPEFVKQALQDYSTRFELSDDGRKVRWRRRSNLVRFRDAESESSASIQGQSPQKRTKTTHDVNESSGDQHNGSRQEHLRQKRGQLSYTPLFSHCNSDDSDTSLSSDGESMESLYPVPQGGAVSSGITSSGGLQTNARHMTAPSKPRGKRADGPIIFYNNARFCTDLSGDNKTEEAMTYNPILYHVAIRQPVGADATKALATSMGEKKGPLDSFQALPQPDDLYDYSVSETMGIMFPPQTPITSASEKSPLDMEVSGVGGIYPADNFAITVKTQHSRMDALAPQTVRQNVPGRYLDRVADVLMKNGASRPGRSAFHKEVLSTRQRDLPPSALPPASCYIPIGETDSEYDSDCESTMSVTIDDTKHPHPTVVPQLIEMSSWISVESDEVDEDEDNDDDENMSDSSLDFLATAREIDPESIRAREREYDANVAERLAEEIPAGSSAATAGGGSGFASPASRVAPEEVAEARRTLREKQAGVGLSS